MVRMVRATRDHDDIRVGASVRGAIDAVGLARELAGLRGVPATDWQVGLLAAKAALTGRIKLHEACKRTPEEVVAELYEREFGRDPDREEETPGEP
jgi:MoxR-like ATPase